MALFTEAPNHLKITRLVEMQFFIHARIRELRTTQENAPCETAQAIQLVIDELQELYDRIVIGG